MHKEMYEITVFTTKDCKIVIEAPGWCDERQTIVISPEQAKVVARWLLEAEAKTLGERNGE